MAKSISHAVSTLVTNIGQGLMQHVIRILTCIVHFIMFVKDTYNKYNLHINCKYYLFQISVIALEKFVEDAKGVIRSHQLKKDRYYNSQKNTDKRTNNDL